jgi:hypothetical protein
LDLRLLLRTDTLSRYPGVLILCKEYVRKQGPMEELRILLRRWQAGGVELVPVLYGMSAEDLRDMRQLYAKQAWCVAEEQPAGRVLDGWAADLQQVLRCTLICSDQVRRSSLPFVCLRQAPAPMRSFCTVRARDVHQ